MDLGLKDKVILVTGASKGIGEAIAHAFATEGSKLVLVARRWWFGCQYLEIV